MLFMSAMLFIAGCNAKQIQYKREAYRDHTFLLTRQTQVLIRAVLQALLSNFSIPPPPPQELVSQINIDSPKIVLLYCMYCASRASYDEIKARKWQQ
jgi:hypothetical protein